MTPQEAAALLAVAAAFDNRKPDPDAAQAWAIALDEHRYQDCREAIINHYRISGEWLMPTAVIAGVRRIRDKRITNYGPIEPPADLNPDDWRGYQRWLEDTHRAIADGTLEPPPPVELEHRDITAELANVEREMPRP